jgi:hypothetical protein
MPVVNQSHAAPRVALVPPDPYGYVFVLAEVDVASVTTDVERVEAVATAPELQSTSRPRAALQEGTEPVRTALSRLPTVRAVSVFEAILFAQGSLDRFAPRGTGGHPARYDSLFVAETTTPAAAEALLSDATFTELVDRVRNVAAPVRVFPAANVKKIASVDRSAGGVFLFNFFFADDTEALMNIWDHTAGWWFVEGEMKNSELMRPLRDSEYALVNNARWQDARGPAKAFRSPNYWNFVLANIDANRATAMPSLYRLLR